jgi:hypothetical protein
MCRIGCCCVLLQVRLVVPGEVDGAMNAGRFPMLLHWQAGLDAAGRLAALKLDVTCTVRERCMQGMVQPYQAAHPAWHGYTDQHMSTLRCQAAQ